MCALRAGTCRQVAAAGWWRRPPAPIAAVSPRRAVPCVVRVLTESCDLAVATKAPDFELPEPLTGKAVKLADIAAGAPATLVMFLCVHCPFVVHLKEAINKLTREYKAKGVTVVAISSNSVETHPQDGPEFIAKEAKQLGYVFPYLYDESQDVARAYKVACTPEFFVFDASLGLAYHGRFDGSSPRNNTLVTGNELRAALDAVLASQPVPKAKHSIGCNLKWKPGKEPEWYGTQQVR